MNPSFEVRQGDVIEQLRGMPSESVHTCITSPPYWGLRDYQIVPSVWPVLGRADCVHEWGEWREGHDVREESITGKSRTTDRFYGDESRRFDGNHQKHTHGQFCCICGAWRGCLGLEPEPDLFVRHIVEVFRHVRRVLHRSGTAWVNFGDCYTDGGRGADTGSTLQGTRHNQEESRKATMRQIYKGLPPKNLLMIPSRVALALQADGWYLRSMIPWLKRNGMPESTTDRPTSMVEYVFLFSKSESYFYDRQAVRLPSGGDRGGGRQRAAVLGDGRYVRMAAPKDADGRTGRHAGYQPSSRARRNSDWFFDSWQGMLPDDFGPLAFVVNPQPFSIEMCKACDAIYAQKEYRKLEHVCQQCRAVISPMLKICACGSDELRRMCICNASDWLSHFATFPERLVLPMIQASTSEAGCCQHCGAPYERILEKPKSGDWHPDPAHKHDKGARNGTAKWAKESPQAGARRLNENVARARAARNGDPPQSNFADVSAVHNQPFFTPQTLGWRPTCNHPLYPSAPVSAVVLDPFSGSGRTGFAAVKLGRNYIGIEAKPEYVAISNWQHERWLETTTGRHPDEPGSSATSNHQTLPEAVVG